MSLCTNCRHCRKLYVVFSVFIYADCNKPGQTPCSYSGAQIQTDCNFEAKFYSCKCTLVCVYFRCNDVPLESFYSWMVYLYICTIVYSKLYLTLNHQQIQVQEHQGRAIPLNVARYKRAVNSALWLQLTLIACYLPYNIARALLTKRGLSPDGFIAKDFALTLLYVNSTINPLLYCWKIREVR